MIQNSWLDKKPTVYAEKNSSTVSSFKAGS